jgi:hypothetical protein
MMLAMALLAGCLDVAAPGGVRRAQLALYPVYDVAGVRDGTPSDVDSFVVLVQNPPFADTTISVKIPVGEDTVQVTLSVTVASGEDTVGVTFDGYSSVTGLKLYHGTINIPVVAGTPSPPQPVAVTYVGPGRSLGSLSIAPRTAGLRPGNQLQLSYSALDTAGAALPDDSVPVTFISRNELVAVVNAGGLVQAAGNGETYVLVRSVARSSIRDSAQITVAPEPAALIGLSPTSVAIADTVGTSNPAAVNVSVTNAGGGSLTGLAVGTITYGSGASGWLTATLAATTAPTSLTLQVSNTGLVAGTYTATVPVTASGVSSQSVTVTLTMAPATVSNIAIGPGFVAARPGETATLTVTGKNPGGVTVPTGPLTFTSGATGVATVNAAGQITAVAAGTAIVVAQVTATPTIADSILVVVEGNGETAVWAVSNGRAFDILRVGDTVRVRVALDLRGVSPEKLGSYNAQLNWDAARLTFVDATTVTGGFATGGTIINTTGTGTGQLRFGAADPAGHAGPTVALLDIKLVATSAGSSPLALTLTDLSAAGTFTNLLPGARIVSGRVEVK